MRWKVDSTGRFTVYRYDVCFSYASTSSVDVWAERRVAICIKVDTVGVILFGAI